MKRFYAYFSVVDSFVYAIDAETQEQAATMVYDRLHNDYDKTIDDSNYLGWLLEDSVTIEDPDGLESIEIQRDSLFLDDDLQ